MDRREFLRAVAALSAAGLASEAAAIAPEAEGLLEGVTYISQTYERGGVWFIESWRKTGGEVWKTLTTESQIVSHEKWDFCPFVQLRLPAHDKA